MHTVLYALQHYDTLVYHEGTHIQHIIPTVQVCTLHTLFYYL